MSEGAQSLEQLAVDAEKLEVVRDLRCLGMQLRFARNVANKVGEGRVSKGLQAAKRILWVPLPMGARAMLCSALVCQQSLYGIEGAALPQNAMNKLRNAVLQAVWGVKRKMKAKEIVFTLFMQGHLVDPQQNAAYRSLVMLRRMLQQQPELVEPFARVWQLRQQQADDAAPGPVAVLAKVLQRLGWVWDEPLSFDRGARPRLQILGGDDKLWRHEIRDGLRAAEWRIAAERREDCKGLDHPAGVDRTATAALMSSWKISPYQRGLLQGVQSGSLRLQERLHKAGLKESPMCPHCGEGPETVDHCFWECPRWEAERQNEFVPSRVEARQLPPCTRSLGIFLEDEEIVAMCDAYQGAEETWEEQVEADTAADRVIVWTDGASRHNADCRFRRAGAGVWYGSDHALNMSLQLPGKAQTNQRAELFAAIKAIERDRRKLDIRTDSAYVMGGAAALQRGAGVSTSSDNIDLWKRLEEQLQQHGAGEVVFTKVKGHAKARDVERGYVTMEDKEGNDGADQLAVQAALAQAAPRELVAKAQRKKATATDTHWMMLSILEKRFAAEGGEAAEEMVAQMQCDELLQPEMADGIDQNYDVSAVSIPVDAG